MEPIYVGKTFAEFLEFMEEVGHSPTLWTSCGNDGNPWVRLSFADDRGRKYYVEILDATKDCFTEVKAVEG
jgi:hypothetical protein